MPGLPLNVYYVQDIVIQISTHFLQGSALCTFIQQSCKVWESHTFLFYMYIQEISSCMHNMHTVNPPLPCSYKCTKKILHTQQTHTNQRRSQGALTNVLIAWGKTQNRNKTQAVCSLDIHDNNKLAEFTSHILFILFDRVVGDLHVREFLGRIQNILDVWMKGATSSKACRLYVFICHI